MNERPVPNPASARVASASPTSGAIIESPLKTAIQASASSPIRRPPKRSLARPPGICITACVKKSAVVNRPITARPTP